MIEEITNIEEYLAQHERKQLLRFITCGSVDDGKSTLIGRLLHDTQMIYEDQLNAIERDSKTSGTRGGDVDLALLVDGLASEREQGITIDVAYRYFSTDKRKFIIADTPGHEQYTRNMATGASTAKLAVILIDARHGVLTQTKRHSYICSLLGIQHLAIAVNKMDLVDFSEDRFNEIVEDYTAFSGQLHGNPSMHFLPVSALDGDNVAGRSDKTPWYSGPTLLELLENVELTDDEDFEHLRLPIQYVNRPNLDFRGFCGTLKSGILTPGQAIKVVPGDTTSRVKSLVTWEGEAEYARPGDAVTVTLEDEVDVSRGSVITTPESGLHLGRNFEAHVVWMHDDPLEIGKRYDIKMMNQYVRGRVTKVVHQIDVNTLATRDTDSVPLNGIARVQVELSAPVPFDKYRELLGTGNFIFIDQLSNVTVGAGMIEQPLADNNVVWHRMEVNKTARSDRNHQKPTMLWLTGLSGSGKSTLADALEKQLFGMGYRTYSLDGDNVRHGLCNDLGFSERDRVENIRRVGEVGKLMVDAGLIVFASFISPFRRERQLVRQMLEPGEFVEIHVSTPLEVCEERDPKGLYKKARAGQITNFTGISSPYEEPEDPDIRIDASKVSLEESVMQIVKLLQDRNILN